MAVHAKKVGATTCVIYLDGDRPLPIASFDDQPMGFPMTLPIAEAQARYGKLHMVEAPKRPDIEAGTVVNRFVPGSAKEDGTMALEQRTVLMPTEQEVAGAMKQTAVPPSQPQMSQATSVPVDALMARMADELRSMFVRYHAGTQDKAELKAVCNFLLRIDPSIKPFLEELKTPPKQEEFDL